MVVLLNPAVSAQQAASESAKAPEPQPRQAKAKPAAAVEAAPETGSLQANVTFRRDSAGQIYYVVTDAQTGKELQEVPAQQVRNVAEGIQEYLKAEQSKHVKPVELKG